MTYEEALGRPIETVEDYVHAAILHPIVKHDHNTTLDERLNELDNCDFLRLISEGIELIRNRE